MACCVEVGEVEVDLGDVAADDDGDDLFVAERPSRNRLAAPALLPPPLPPPRRPR